MTLALPQDVQGEPYDYPAEFLEKRVHHVERRLPTKGQIERAVALVKSRSKPIVICGGGVRYSEAGKELKEFCAAFGVPFGETQAGKGVISWEDPIQPRRNGGHRGAGGKPYRT